MSKVTLWELLDKILSVLRENISLIVTNAVRSVASHAMAPNANMLTYSIYLSAK
jgi:hypothetical protein